MKIRCLVHVSFELPANIETWARDRGHEFVITKAFDPAALAADIDDHDGLVIMGGPMNVDEEAIYPWLREEKQFIRRSIDAKKPVLGICLGAQLIASVLGAKITRNPEPEIGWFPVNFNEEAKKYSFLNFAPPQFVFFHWHFDTFEIPKGAFRIASSEGCLNQGFVFNENTVALQFHPEMTHQSIGGLIENASKDITHRKYIQSANEMLAQPERLSASKEFVYQLLDNLFK